MNQPRAPPETVIREPFSVLPLEPVTRLTGHSFSSLRLRSKGDMALIGPGRLGLRRRAEAPSVPVTCSPRSQSSPVIFVEEPSPVTREAGFSEGSLTTATVGWN